MAAPMFTTRHYVVIARIISEWHFEARETLFSQFDDIFTEDNHRYRSATFRKACVLGDA